MRARGWSILRIDAEMTLHDAAMVRIAQWWRRSIRSGYGYAQVWSVTRRTGLPLYGRELARAMLWGVAMPVVILVASILYLPAGLALTMLYPLQTIRIAVARGAGQKLSWSYALLMTVAKFAEARGALRFIASGRRQKVAIDYKA